MRGLNACSAGIHNAKPVTKDQLEWADVVICMENEHRKVISERFPEIYFRKKILSFNIPDDFHYGSPQLAELLEKRIGEIKDDIELF